jgi:hypothetical protein
VPGLQAGADLTPELVLDRWDEVVALDGGRAILAGREELELYDGPARFMPEPPATP